jgi:hypothetical protein
MNKDVLRQFVNVLALSAVIIVNGLANALPLNGLSTGEISDRFDVYFVPAGYVFAIWGVIYLGLIAFVIYQALPSQKANRNLRRLGYLFALSCLANVTWIFLWHYEQFALTLVAMLALLFSLILIYLRLDIGLARVSRAEKWAVHVPFSIYLGWVSVATIANVTSLLDYLNWNGFGLAPEIWFMLMMAAATLIGAAMAFIRRDVAYLLVFIWAFVGIALKHEAVPLVAWTTWIATGAVVLLLLFALFTRRIPVQTA